MLLNQENTD